MLGSLDGDVAIGLVDVDSVLEALGDFLGQADLLLRHQLVWQALGLGTFSTLLSLRADDLLSGHCPLGRR